MKLERLVPPVEICKQIPEGEFLDAAHAWVLSDVVGFVCRTSGCEQISGQEWQLIRSNSSRIIRARKRGEEIYVAPTLEEIMAAFSYCRVYKKSSGKFIACRNKFREVDENGASAALKLCLKVKGGEEVAE